MPQPKEFSPVTILEIADNYKERDPVQLQLFFDELMHAIAPWAQCSMLVVESYLHRMFEYPSLAGKVLIDAAQATWAVKREHYR